MLEHVNEVAVLVSAILTMAVGSIWYSPLLFGRQWMRAIGGTEEMFDTSRRTLALQLILALVSSFALLFVLAVFVSYAKALTVSLVMLGSLLSVLLGALVACVVIWEQKPFSYFIINIGYAVVIIFGGLVVLWHWPW